MTYLYQTPVLNASDNDNIRYYFFITGHFNTFLSCWLTSWDDCPEHVWRLFTLYSVPTSSLTRMESPNQIMCGLGDKGITCFNGKWQFYYFPPRLFILVNLATVYSVWLKWFLVWFFLYASGTHNTLCSHTELTNVPLCSGTEPFLQTE